MTSSATSDALRQVVRDRRVHYDVVPEIVFRGSERVKVGFRVRLWGIHGKGARALPGCPKCWDLADDLRRIAEDVVPTGERASRTELEPFRPALYDSRIIPATDEVTITIRLLHRDRYDRPIDACEERCLKEIRARLRDLGVPER